MPAFSREELEKCFSPVKVNVLCEWFDTLEREAPQVAECFKYDELSLISMQTFLREVITLWPSSLSAFQCISSSIMNLRNGKVILFGNADSLCLLGPAVSTEELREAVFLHIRRRSLSDWILRHTSLRLGQTFMAESDKSRGPTDWIQYCSLHDVFPIGDARGTVWLAPLEDVLGKMNAETQYTANEVYWYFRHWLVVGMPWQFTHYSSVDEALEDLDADRLFVLLRVRVNDAGVAKVPTVLDTWPGESHEKFFFRPRAWWRMRGENPGGFGLTLDLLDNWEGKRAEPGVREGIALAIDLRNIEEVKPGQIEQT